MNSRRYIMQIVLTVALLFAFYTVQEAILKQILFFALLILAGYIMASYIIERFSFGDDSIFQMHEKELEGLISDPVLLKKVIQGLTRLHNDQNAKAITSFQACLPLCENDVQRALLYKYLGFCYRELSDHTHAMQAFQKGVQCNPNDHKLWGMIGLEFDVFGEIEQAKRCFHKVLALVPEEPIAHINLALYHNAEKDFEHAIYHAKIASLKDPYRLVCYCCLAIAYAGLHDANNANHYKEKALLLGADLATLQQDMRIAAK
ncbi:MAG: tetratricopeptide repeat protein [Erysipelotrichaceae bacterium]